APLVLQQPDPVGQPVAWHLARHRVSRGPLRAPGSPKNRTCEFPRIRLKPFESHFHMTRPGPSFSPTSAILTCSHHTPCEAERAPGPRGPVICVLSFGGFSSSLATKDPSDVCSLSRPVMLQPVSAPLQHGIRFFRHLKPAHRSANLTASPLVLAG